MTMTIEEFCDRHSACPAGREWAKENCLTLREVWQTAPPEYVLWIATRQGVFDETVLRRWLVFVARQCATVKARPQVLGHLETIERYAGGLATAEEFGEAKEDLLAIVRQEPGNPYGVHVALWATGSTTAARWIADQFDPNMPTPCTFDENAGKVLAAWFRQRACADPNFEAELTAAEAAAVEHERRMRLADATDEAVLLETLKRVDNRHAHYAALAHTSPLNDFRRRYWIEMRYTLSYALDSIEIEDTDMRDEPDLKVWQKRMKPRGLNQSKAAKELAGDTCAAAVDLSELGNRALFGETVRRAMFRQRRWVRLPAMYAYWQAVQHASMRAGDELLREEQEERQ